MTTNQTEEMKKLSAEVLIKEIEEEVEECFPNDLTTQNEIYTRLFNHIQARFLYNEMINKPTELWTD
tara:strand:+ start:1939 stop:2139 length:201 start_codon:yes stop_codon:yes gene_type:complete